jgi:hypothetical protein
MARMQTARRRRPIWAIAVSLAVHLAAGVALLSQRPPDVPPEPPIISVLLVARPPPPASASEARPAPLRLHRPPQPILPPDVPTAPIAPPAPPGAAATAAQGPGPVALHPAPLPAGPKGDVRTALRHSYVGCANRELVGLNRAERDFCDEQFGKGAKDAKFAGLGLTAAKQRLLDAAGARKEADYRYKHDQTTSAAPVIGDDARPGQTAESMKRSLGVDRPTATIPF